MKLSKLERISLIQQHQILQKLHPDDAASHEKAVEVLSNGYEYMYDELYQFVYDDDDIMSEDDCKEVWETLTMFESIDKQLVGQVAAKLRSLRPPEPYKGKGIKFKGEQLRRKAGKTAAK